MYLLRGKGEGMSMDLSINGDLRRKIKVGGRESWEGRAGKQRQAGWKVEACRTGK